MVNAFWMMSSTGRVAAGKLALDEVFRIAASGAGYPRGYLYGTAFRVPYHSVSPLRMSYTAVIIKGKKRH